MPGSGRQCERNRRRCGRPIRGFMAPCLLLALEEEQSHGYDLMAALAPFGLGQTHPSLVYRALRQMEEDGLVCSMWDTETGAGPARRVYHITKDGQRYLDGWVQDLEETDRVLHAFMETVARVRGKEQNTT